MIKDVAQAIEKTADWIRDRIYEADSHTAVIGISGGVDSAVVAGLCASKVRLDIIGVIMPCDSSPSAMERADSVIEKFGLQRIHVDLSTAYKSVYDQYASQYPISPDCVALSSSSLRSCLRAPTLDFVAKINNGVIVGTGNRDEDECTRYYNKRGDGAVDIAPIAKFHKSEIYQLAKELGVPGKVISAAPSADLLGADSGQEDERDLGMTYKEIEAAIQFAQKHTHFPYFRSGITADHLENAIWAADLKCLDISDRETLVMERLARMERATRHKINSGIPVFDARAALNLDDDHPEFSFGATKEG